MRLQGSKLIGSSCAGYKPNMAGRASHNMHWRRRAFARGLLQGCMLGLDFMDIKTVAVMEKVPTVTAASTLFEAVETFMQHYLPSWPHAIIIEIMMCRFADAPRGNIYCCDLLMEVDEAAKCLEKDDETAFQMCQQQAIVARRECTAFRDACRERRAAIRVDTVAVPMAKKKAKAKPAPKAIGAVPLVRALPDHMDAMMEQRIARTFCQPGSVIWKSRVDVTWHGRFRRLMPIVDRSVRRHCSGALKQVVTPFWRDYCVFVGVLVADSPMTNLWSEVAPAPMAA